ncbi:hypothetical protein Sjap_005779 [Stephania japonica]|uniref:Uncharacterized protein n=1 Tax=Stephania japonica TaxID=461633 RepID=A0AAP0K4M3_9MAGN
MGGRRRRRWPEKEATGAKREKSEWRERMTTLAGAETMLAEQSRCDGGAENDGGERGDGLAENNGGERGDSGPVETMAEQKRLLYARDLTQSPNSVHDEHPVGARGDSHLFHGPEELDQLVNETGIAVASDQGVEELVVEHDDAVGLGLDGEEEVSGGVKVASAGEELEELEEGAVGVGEGGVGVSPVEEVEGFGEADENEKQRRSPSVIARLIELEALPGTPREPMKKAELRRSASKSRVSRDQRRRRGRRVGKTVEHRE